MNPWTDSFEQYRQDILGEDKKKSDKQTKQRWQDDDGDNKWYEKSDVDGKISDREKKAKKHDCASKVKHEEFGIGNPIKGMHDLDESGNVAHYDVFFEHGIEKNIPVSSLEILVTEMHEHVIHEGKKNCGCGQDPCITYGKGKNAHKMPDGTVMPGKTHKEEVVTEKISASGYARAKKWREAQAAQKDRESNAKWEEKARTHKWDGKTWNKRDKPTHDEGQGPHAKKLAAHNANNESVEVNHIDGSTTQIIDVVRAPAMVAAPKFSNWKEEMSYEALKGEKLDIEAEKGKVKNQVDINPTIKTEEKKNLDEGGRVKYYKHDDRNPNTGIPKGLKATPIRTEKEVSKNLDRTTLAQSYETEGDMLVDEGLGKLIDKGITGAFNTADKVSSAMDKNPVGRVVKKGLKALVSPSRPGDGGSNRLSPTAASQKAQGLRTTLGNSYEPEGELVDEKISASGYARAKKYREDQARQKDRKEQEYFAQKAKTHKWDGEKWNKREVAKEEVEVVNEISPDLALKASKEADKKRGKLAAAGDKEGAAKKNAQAGRLYKAQAKKRLNREETEILDDLLESGLFSDEEIESILKMNEEE